MDYVSESVSSVLMLILVGDCVAYHVARPRRNCLATAADESECAFDDEAADRVDLVWGLLVLMYVLFYAVGYRTIYAAWRSLRSNGHSRPWVKGGLMRNNWKPTSEAYHLKMDDEYCRRWGRKYLGQGTRVDNPLEDW